MVGELVSARTDSLRTDHPPFWTSGGAWDIEFGRRLPIVWTEFKEGKTV
jgi:hypothetical protein